MYHDVLDVCKSERTVEFKLLNLAMFQEVAHMTSSIMLQEAF